MHNVIVRIPPYEEKIIASSRAEDDAKSVEDKASCKRKNLENQVWNYAQIGVILTAPWCNVMCCLL